MSGHYPLHFHSENTMGATIKGYELLVHFMYLGKIQLVTLILTKKKCIQWDHENEDWFKVRYTQETSDF